MSFSSLKKNRGNGLDAINAKLDSYTQKNYVDDSADFWTPTADKAGNGYARIRLLPQSEGDETPVIKYFDHSFQRNGKWYIERSLTTFGEDDPVGEMNRAAYDSGDEDRIRLVKGDDTVKPRLPGSKRRTHYVANILVIEDEGKPDNNGRVFKYRFGAKIFEMIENARKPKFKDKKAINPFDYWEGADLVIRFGNNKGGQRDYSESSFDAPSELFGGDETKLESLYNSQFKLRDELDRESKKWKTYEELTKRLAYVNGTSQPAAKTAEARTAAEPEAPKEAFRRPEKTVAPKAAVEETAPWDGDDEMSYFKGIADDD